MNLSPAQKVPAFIEGDAAQLAPHMPYLAALARLSEAQVVDELPAEDAPVAMTGAGKVMLHVEIDRDAERARLAKEAQRLEGEIAQVRGQARQRVVRRPRAPAAVVEQEKKRLADINALLARRARRSSRSWAEAPAASCRSPTSSAPSTRPPTGATTSARRSR